MLQFSATTHRQCCQMEYFSEPYRSLLLWEGLGGGGVWQWKGGGGGSALAGGEGIGSHAATVGSMAEKAPKFDATPSSVCFFKTCSFHFQ